MFSMETNKDLYVPKPQFVLVFLYIAVLYFADFFIVTSMDTVHIEWYSDVFYCEIMEALVCCANLFPFW